MFGGIIGFASGKDANDGQDKRKKASCCSGAAMFRVNAQISHFSPP